MSIADNLLTLKHQIPENVKVIAVTKTKSIAEMLELYATGHRQFGENKVQEITRKKPLLPQDIEWHFIGHLQSNKVKSIAPFIHMVHSIDSAGLLKELNKEGLRNGRVLNCLLQFHIAAEETKFGLDLAEARAILDSGAIKTMGNISVSGVMGMATFTRNVQVIRSEFRVLKDYFNILKGEYFSGNARFREISMGMSSDYPIAIEEGATLIRVGTAIFEP